MKVQMTIIGGVYNARNQILQQGTDTNGDAQGKDCAEIEFITGKRETGEDERSRI